MQKKKKEVKITKPKFRVVWSTVERLLKRGCSGALVASKIGCSYDTLKKYYFLEGKNIIKVGDEVLAEFSTFSEYIAYFQSKGDVDVLDKYYKLALQGDRHALEFILKNRLGWSDKKQIDQNHSGEVKMNQLTLNTPPPSEDE